MSTMRGEVNPAASGLHESTFGYLKPSEKQQVDMQIVREASRAYADTLETVLPAGADKNHALRKLREVAMWANVAITRNADGSPRDDDDGASEGSAAGKVA